MTAYLLHALSAPPAEDGQEGDSDSLQRAAATLAVAGGIEALMPHLLARLAAELRRAVARERIPPVPAESGRPARAAAGSRVAAGPGRRSWAARFDDEDLPELFDHLEDTDARVRAAACYAMGRLEIDSTAPLLVERLRRGEPVEQAAAIQALGRLSPEALADLEVCLLPETSPALLALALEVLAARPVPSFEGRVLQLAEDKRPAVRRSALRAIARLPVPRADVLLLRALADRDQAMQVEALELLVGAGWGAVHRGAGRHARHRRLAPLPRDPALGRCRAKAAAAKLRTVFPDCGPHEQLQIVTSLIRIAPPWIGEFLRTRLADREVEMRRIAAQGLADLAEEHELPVLLPLAEDADWSIRNEAARGLGRLAKPVTRGVLLALARDVEPVVAATARASLERLQPEALRIPA